MVGTHRYYHNDGGRQQPRSCAQKRLGEIHESPDEEEDDVDEGDEGIEQLHHDGAGVGAVQALYIEVLLLHLLMESLNQVVFTIEIFQSLYLLMLHTGHLGL